MGELGVIGTVLYLLKIDFRNTNELNSPSLNLSHLYDFVEHCTQQRTILTFQGHIFLLHFYSGFILDSFSCLHSDFFALNALFGMQMLA